MVFLCQGFSKFGNRGFGNPNLLGGQGKTARDIKREKAAKRAAKAQTAAFNKAKADNLAKKLNINGLAGYKFGDKCESVTLQKLPKLYFTRYEYVSLASSPSYGVVSITLTAKDPIIETEEQIKSEISRMMGVFSEKFKVRFTAEVNRSTNGKCGTQLGVSTRCDSITGGIRRRVLEEKTVITEPPTKVTLTAKEEFANCTVTFEGVQDLVSNSVTMTFKVSKKLQ